MIVRPANRDDLDAVSRLNAAVQSLHHAARPDWFVPPDLPAIRSWFSSTIDRDDVFVLVAEDERHAVGYAVATLHRRPGTPFTRAMSILEIDQIGVEGNTRRAGIGSRLIERMADLAVELDVDHTMLTVWGFNDAAEATFRSRGFVDAMHRMELERA